MDDNRINDIEALKQMKQELLDYYGTATLVNPAAMADLINVDTTSPEKLAEMADNETTNHRGGR